MKFRKQKGVTLIALVVTVIVLLILAGVSITTLFDQNDKDLISKTYSTKELAETSQELEQDKLDDLYGYGIYPPDDEVLAPDTEVTEPDVTEPEVTPSGNVIPEGGKYTQADGTVLGPGENFPDTVTTGDEYTYGDYRYKYNYYYTGSSWVKSETQLGWGVAVLDTTKTQYGEMLAIVNNKDVNTLYATFKGCTNMTSLVASFVIPPKTYNMNSMFYECIALKSLPTTFIMTDNVTSSVSMFYNTDSLTSLPSGFTIPESVTSCQNMFYSSGIASLPSGFKLSPNAESLSDFFMWCENLKYLPSGFFIPEGVTSTYQMFCQSGILAIPTGFTLPSTLTNASYMFEFTDIKSGTLTIPANVTNIRNMFRTSQYFSGTVIINGEYTDYSKYKNAFYAGKANIVQGTCSTTTLNNLIKTKTTYSD